MQLNYRWRATIVLVMGLFMAVLDNTIVSVALPQIQNAFETDFNVIACTYGPLPQPWIGVSRQAF